MEILRPAFEATMAFGSWFYAVLVALVSITIVVVILQDRRRRKRPRGLTGIFGGK